MDKYSWSFLWPKTATEAFCNRQEKQIKLSIFSFFIGLFIQWNTQFKSLMQQKEFHNNYLVEGEINLVTVSRL